MDREKVATSLRRLAQTSPNRSKAAQLRLVIDDIEAALAAGVRSDEIIATLAENGLIISARTFHGTLYRIRKTGGAPRRAVRVSQTQPFPTPATRPEVQTSADTPSKSVREIMAENPNLTKKQAEELYVDQFTPKVANPLLAKYAPQWKG